MQPQRFHCQGVIGASISIGALYPRGHLCAGGYLWIEQVPPIALMPLVDRATCVNGGEIPGQRGGVKAGQWRMSAVKIVSQLTNGNFASVWIDSLGGGLVARIRGEFPAMCGLRQPITLAIHR